MDDNYVIIAGENGPEVWDLEEFLTSDNEDQETKYEM